MTELQENMQKGTYSVLKKERKNKKISKCVLTKLCFCNSFREETAAPTSICSAEKQLLKV